MIDSDGLKTVLEQVYNEIDDPTQGLPEEVYLFITRITPMINTDLLIRDDQGRILLAWREDEVYGVGWHVPGGILRLKETFQERIQRTALKEIGCNVIAEKEPAEIIPLIYKEAKTRGHFITFVYECRLPEGHEIDNHGLSENSPGYLKWFSSFPENMLRCHECYRKYFDYD